MDGDAFFVACEIAKDPSLRGLPVVTGEERGIVTAASYEAKALGVIRGTPIFKLKKQFPSVLVLPGDYQSYADYSSRMFDIVRRYVDDVEEYSIDECFADLTGLDKPLKMSYKQIAEKIKKEVNEELDLSISIGLGPTKCLAKVASKWIKPNGLTVIERGSTKDFLSNVSIGKIWGIGRQTSHFLRKHGVNTAQDFVDKKLEWIEFNLSKPYKVIWEELNGNSILEVDPNPKTTYSSMQKTRSFGFFTNDEKFLFSQLSKHVEDACAKARYYKLIPKRFSFFLKTKEFQYLSCSLQISSPTNTPETLMTLVKDNFKKVYRKGILYRTAGVTISELSPESTVQTDLFGNTARAHKFELVHKQIDVLKDKYGRRVVYLASTHQALKNKRKGTDVDDLDRDLLFL